jgi:hypothetical protein
MKILLGIFRVLNVQKAPLFWLLYVYNTGTCRVLEAGKKASKPCSDLWALWKIKGGDFLQVGRYRRLKMFVKPLENLEEPCIICSIPWQGSTTQ